jgi:phosphoglycolate phosphatase-like HAD superfamily hydrolase
LTTQIPRLFVDIDGTLIDSKDNFYQGTIDFIKNFKKSNPEYKTIVWSGGGDWYAITWANRAALQWDLAMSKQPIDIRDGDIFLDDADELLKSLKRLADIQGIDALFINPCWLNQNG